MNRNIVLLNVALAALGGVLFWQLRANWRKATVHERQVLAKSLPAKPAVVLPAAPPPQGPAPADYIDVAQRNLFSRDRNPNVIIEVTPPPPPPPEEPVPQLPFYYGQMSIGVPTAVLSLNGSEQKGYHAGDDVGPFKLAKFDRDTITFTWKDKTLERKLAELRPKETQVTPQAAPAAAPAQNNSANVKSLTGDGQANPSVPTAPSLGADMGGGFRACVGGDTSPAGTVLDGYRKVISRGLMASTCYWEQVK